MKNAIRLALSAAGAPSAPEWILLLPAGDITARDGRAFNNHTPDRIIASFATDQRDIPVDYEHATEVRAPAGLDAPAVGWIKQVKIEAGEILGRVEWTEEGRRAVEGKSYRYISPVVHFDPASRSVMRISSVALTNDPALYIKSLNRREADQNEDTSMLKAIAVALKLAETATEAEILAAINTQATEKEALRVKADGDPDPAKYVLRSEHDVLIATCSQLRSENKQLKDDQAEKGVVALVDDAISQGKVIPAIRDSELQLCRAIGAEAYKERLSKLGAIVNPGENETARKLATDKTGKLDDAQKEMCRRLGLKEEAYLKTLTDA